MSAASSPITPVRHTTHTTQGCVAVHTCSPCAGMVCRTHKPILSLYEGKCQHLGKDCVAKFVPHTTRIVRVLNSSWVCLPCARDIMFPNDRDDKALLLERLVLHAVHVGGIEGQTCVLLRNILYILPSGYMTGLMQGREPLVAHASQGSVQLHDHISHANSAYPGIRGLGGTKWIGMLDGTGIVQGDNIIFSTGGKGTQTGFGMCAKRHNIMDYDLHETLQACPKQGSGAQKGCV